MAALSVNILGVLVFLFVFWKKLKEDYESGLIFSLATTVLVGILVGFLISSKFFPNWFFWLEFFGASLGLTIFVTKFKLRVYEIFEGLVAGLIPWLSLTFLFDSVANKSLTSFMAFLTCLMLVFIYYFLSLKYKLFSWYKSGRVGLSGLVTLWILVFTRFTVAIFLTNVLSFVGKAEVFISGFLTIVIAVLIFRLAKD